MLKPFLLLLSGEALSLWLFLKGYLGYCRFQQLHVLVTILIRIFWLTLRSIALERLFGWDLRNPQRHCANNYGFIVNKDFHYDLDAIVLVGDSFVEANMLPVHQGLAAQIESRLKDKIVFALGGQDQIFWTTQNALNFIGKILVAKFS